MTWLRAVRSPNLRAYVERFIQSLNFEVLNKFVIAAERHLNYISGMAATLQPGAAARGPGASSTGDGDASGRQRRIQRIDVVCSSRLVGLLNSYSRRAA